MWKSLIFGQKPWIIPFGKSRCFALYKTLVFLFSVFNLFYPEHKKTIFSDLISPKNTNKKYFDIWTKSMVYPLRKMSFLFRVFKTLVFWIGLKFILFYPKYQETIFSGTISSKTLMRKSLNFLQKTMD